MKPILIDEFIKDANETQTEVKITIDGNLLTGWQIAKPLNYDSDFLSTKDREEMAKYILEGKAIAIRYFEDLEEDEKVEYVKSKLR